MKYCRSKVNVRGGFETMRFRRVEQSLSDKEIERLYPSKLKQEMNGIRVANAKMTLVAVKRVREYRDEFKDPECLKYFNIGKQLAREIDADLINQRESKYSKQTVQEKALHALSQLPIKSVDVLREVIAQPQNYGTGRTAL